MTRRSEHSSALIKAAFEGRNLAWRPLRDILREVGMSQRTFRLFRERGAIPTGIRYRKRRRPGNRGGFEVLWPPVLEDFLRDVARLRQVAHLRGRPRASRHKRDVRSYPLLRFCLWLWGWKYDQATVQKALLDSVDQYGGTDETVVSRLFYWIAKRPIPTPSPNQLKLALRKATPEDFRVIQQLGHSILTVLAPPPRPSWLERDPVAALYYSPPSLDPYEFVGHIILGPLFRKVPLWRLRHGIRFLPYVLGCLLIMRTDRRAATPDRA